MKSIVRLNKYTALLFASVFLYALLCCSNLQAAKNVGLEELDDMAHIVRLHIDGITVCKKPVITQRTAKDMSMLIKARIDDELRLISKKISKDKKLYAIYSAKTKSCSKTCHCGLYSDLFSVVSTSKAQRKSIEFKNLAASLSTKQVKKCVIKKTSLCDLEVFKSALSESIKFQTEAPSNY